MAVMMTSEVNGQTQKGYEGMLEVLLDPLKQSAGFMMHMSHPSENGWRIVEVWDSREDAARFYADCVAPRLPDGIRPKLSFQPLHDFVKP